jgi:hypothetical protein
VSALSAIRRQLDDHVGDDQQQLQVLRKLLASSEEPKVLRALAVALEEFRDYAGDKTLGAVVDLADRLHEKMSRLGVTPTAPRRTYVPHNGAGVSPQVRMIVTDWSVDEFGNQSRTISSVEDQAPPP